MTTRTDTNSYEVSSESGRERMVRVPWARLKDATPTLGDPAAVTALVGGTELTGTVVNAGTAADPYAILNCAVGAVYWHNVRNVLTYGQGPVEATWGALNIGDPVYYDSMQDGLNGIKLSTAPTQFGGAANPLFGNIILHQEEDADDYPKGDDKAGSSHACAIFQVQ